MTLGPTVTPDDLTYTREQLDRAIRLADELQRILLDLQARDAGWKLPPYGLTDTLIVAPDPAQPRDAGWQIGFPGPTPPDELAENAKVLERFGSAGRAAATGAGLPDGLRERLPPAHFMATWCNAGWLEKLTNEHLRALHELIEWTQRLPAATPDAEAVEIAARLPYADQMTGCRRGLVTTDSGTRRQSPRPPDQRA